MVTFLSGGTGTPKLLDGAGAAFPPDRITVVANTGDDVEIGGLIVCPDVDTLLYQAGGILDRETWWGIADDTENTHDAIGDIARAANLPDEPQYLSDRRQTAGRRLSSWRRFAAPPEFMTLGDRDRAFHVVRTGLIDRGYSLSEAIEVLADGLGMGIDLLVMSDDPVATLVHTPDGPMHFQEFWVRKDGDPEILDVEYRGVAEADPAPGVEEALTDDVVIGPSNPVAGIGPMLAIDGIVERLRETTVVVVSPFVGEEAFSGPAVKMMEAVGTEPGTRGLARSYPFADAFVLDEDDDAEFDAPVVRTDVAIDGRDDAARVVRSVAEALERSRR